MRTNPPGLTGGVAQLLEGGDVVVDEGIIRMPNVQHSLGILFFFFYDGLQ